MFLQDNKHVIVIKINRYFSIFRRKIREWEEKLSFTTRQCTLSQLVSFQKMIQEPSFSLDEWIVAFVEERVWKLSKYQKNAIFLVNHWVWDAISKTYFKDCFQQAPKAKKKDWLISIWHDDLDVAPFESNIAFLAKETSTSIIELYEKCSITDIEYLSDAVIWNINAMSKDGKKKNRLRALARKAKERSAEEKQTIREQLKAVPDSWNTRDFKTEKSTWFSSKK